MGGESQEVPDEGAVSTSGVREVFYLCPGVRVPLARPKEDRLGFDRDVCAGVRLPRKGLNYNNDEVLRVVKNVAPGSSPDVFSPFPSSSTLVLREPLGTRLLGQLTVLAPPGCELYRLRPVWLVHLFEEPRRGRDVPFEQAEAITERLAGWRSWHPGTTEYPPLRPKAETDAIAGEHVELAPPPMIRLTEREDYRASPWQTPWADRHEPPPAGHLAEHARVLGRYPLFFAGPMVCRREVIDLLRPHLDARVFHVMECRVP